MRRRLRERSEEDEEDEEDADSEPPPGYRHARARRPEAIRPEGEVLDATPEERRALAAIGVQARNRIIGMFVGAALLSRFAAPTVDSVFPGFGLLMVLGAMGLAGYALWSRRAPPGIGPTIVRVAPRGAIGAGQFLTITLLIHPRHQIDLDRVEVRLVARRRSPGGSGEGEIVASSKGVLAVGLTIEGDHAARLQTTLLVPEDAPPTSQKRGISWRVEVSFGELPVAPHRATIRVLPLEKRLRDRAERRKRGELP